MRFKKLRKIYRIIFPKKFTKSELFANTLESNVLIKTFIKSDFIYELELIDGLKLFLRDHNYSDYEVFKQIFNNKEYGIVLNMMNLNQDFEKEKIIIDAGANVGYTSIFFSSYLDSAKIFGIEPSYDNLQIFEKNKNFLKKPENIRTYHRALSDKSSKTFKIQRDFRDKMDWAITTKEDNDGEIKGITINEIIQDNNLKYISLLKIDIEGAERFIFKRNNDLSFLNKTQIIAIEIHDEFQVRQDIYDILRTKEFFIFEAGETTIGVNKRFFNLNR